MKKHIVTIISLLITLTFFIIVLRSDSVLASETNLWKFQSIDTMKYSRDMSRVKLGDPTFDIVIDQQIGNIARTGATHVAIATPYDEEFYPVLKRWVDAARRHNIHVWFRGNFSGWEGWFGYPKIDRTAHIGKTKQFVLSHPDLFQDGDVFSACPECENGGPGDPRKTGDVLGHREFLIGEYKVTKGAFKKIRKNIASNYNSMNGDVANLVMDKETTAKLDGLVVVDHYVKTSEELKNDIAMYAKRSGGKVILGEFGAPIPDIHGNLSEDEQALWLQSAMSKLIENEALIGINYWVNIGGSTALWNEVGQPKKAVETLTSFYDPPLIIGQVINELKRPVKHAQIMTLGRVYYADAKGNFSIPLIGQSQTVLIFSSGYKPYVEKITSAGVMPRTVLEKENKDFVYKFSQLFYSIFFFL